MTGVLDGHPFCNETGAATKRKARHGITLKYTEGKNFGGSKFWSFF
jgi:hypothetical protein